MISNVQKSVEHVHISDHDTAPASQVKPRPFGARLREERLRVGLTQVQMAEVGGIKRTTQHLYESDVRTPDLDYLVRVRDAGLDLSYLVLGYREARHSEDFLTFSRTALSNIYQFVDEVCVDADGRLQALAVRLRVFQLLCSIMKDQDASTSSLEVIREEFARFTGT
ncbi:helix-turn-helix domain-containing protein [Hydrogenophaga sp. OTU3427]|uniref:helix-turn-helix domain-containing protein n=1 Tax=Hydrogenophaga sp. OTU3427 TaxID=3043856 RepID=UPI00313EEFDF